MPRYFVFVSRQPGPPPSRMHYTVHSLPTLRCWFCTRANSSETLASSMQGRTSVVYHLCAAWRHTSHTPSRRESEEKKQATFFSFRVLVIIFFRQTARLLQMSTLVSKPRIDTGRSGVCDWSLESADRDFGEFGDGLSGTCCCPAVGGFAPRGCAGAVWRCG